MDINTQLIEHIFKSISGWAAGLFLFGCLILLFRQAIESVVAGFIFKQGADLHLDQPVLISGRAGRLVRVGILKTVFYMDRDRKSKMIVPNIQLKELILEVPLDEHRGNIPAIVAPRIPDADFKVGEGPKR